MALQKHDRVHAGLGLQSARNDEDPPGSRDHDPDDLGLSASNRAVTITLVIGVSLMLLVLLLPYLSEL